MQLLGVSVILEVENTWWTKLSGLLKARCLRQSICKSLSSSKLSSYDLLASIYQTNNPSPPKKTTIILRNRRKGEFFLRWKILKLFVIESVVRKEIALGHSYYFISYMLNFCPKERLYPWWARSCSEQKISNSLCSWWLRQQTFSIARSWLYPSTRSTEELTARNKNSATCCLGCTLPYQEQIRVLQINRSVYKFRSPFHQAAVHGQ